MSSIIRRVVDMDSDKVFFRGDATIHTVAAGTSANCDYMMPGERLFEGTEIILTNHADGDWAKLQVLYGETVLNEFVNKWFFKADQHGQGIFQLGYIANLPAGLALRVAYRSTGAVDVTVKINYFLHEPRI